MKKINNVQLKLRIATNSLSLSEIRLSKKLSKTGKILTSHNLSTKPNFKSQLLE